MTVIQYTQSDGSIKVDCGDYIDGNDIITVLGEAMSIFLGVNVKTFPQSPSHAPTDPVLLAEWLNAADVATLALNPSQLGGWLAIADAPTLGLKPVHLSNLINVADYPEPSTVNSIQVSKLLMVLDVPTLALNQNQLVNMLNAADVPSLESWRIVELLNALIF
jgi:hypothetical protein